MENFFNMTSLQVSELESEKWFFQTYLFNIESFCSQKGQWCCSFGTSSFSFSVVGTNEHAVTIRIVRISHSWTVKSQIQSYPPPPFPCFSPCGPEKSDFSICFVTISCLDLKGNDNWMEANLTRWILNLISPEVCLLWLFPKFYLTNWNQSSKQICLYHRFQNFPSTWTILERRLAPGRI